MLAAYWLGSLRQSTWAINTSDGIILIDSGFDYSVKDLVVDGLQKMHLARFRIFHQEGNRLGQNYYELVNK